MPYIISSGESSEGIVLENDTMTVLDSGVAMTTTVNSEGRLYVSSGGTANSTTVNKMGEMYVSSSGLADETTLNNGGRIYVSGGGLVIRGGDGNDTIWANKGDNLLFGDAGNDRIVGASGDDVIVGCIGNDRMHGGGGDDIFTFCDNWGVDEVEQLTGGKVTLWFASGSMDNWDADTRTYSDGTNSVTVKGGASVELKFGDDGSGKYDELISAGAFETFSSQKILEEPGKGILASL